MFVPVHKHKKQFLIFFLETSYSRQDGAVDTPPACRHGASRARHSKGQQTWPDRRTLPAAEMHGILHKSTNICAGFAIELQTPVCLSTYSHPANKQLSHLEKQSNKIKGIYISSANQSLCANYGNFNLDHQINIQGEECREVGGGICKSVIIQSKGGFIL
jgi:hypothetical protein